MVKEQRGFIRIQRATTHDAVEISNLIRSLCGPFLSSPDGEGAQFYMNAISPISVAAYIASPDYNHYVARDIDGELAGYCSMREHRHLFHLFVAPSHQGKGLAHNLLGTVFKDAIAATNPSTITVNSSVSAVAMWEKFGFVAQSGTVQAHGTSFVPMTLRRIEQLL